MGVPLRCPDYSSVSKRTKSVNVSFKTPTRGEIAHLVIDSTGLKVFGEGEWKVALLNKWILCCGTMKTVVSDNIKSMHYMLAYDGVLSGISVFYQNSADKTE